MARLGEILKVEDKYCGLPHIKEPKNVREQAYGTIFLTLVAVN